MNMNNTSLKKLPDTPLKSEINKMYKNKDNKNRKDLINDILEKDGFSKLRRYLTKLQFQKVIDVYGVPDGYMPLKFD